MPRTVAGVEVGIPKTMTGIDDWAYNFCVLAGFNGANFATYGLPAAPSSLGTLYYAFHNSRIAALKPNKNQNTTTAAKVAMQNLLNYYRPLTQIISNTPEVSAGGITGVSRANKIAIRVNPKINSKAVAGADAVARTKIEVTDSVPIIDILPVDNLMVKCQYHYSGAGLRTGSSKKRSSAKPVGAGEVQFFYKITPPAPGQNPYAGMVSMATATKSPFTYKFDAVLGGRTAYIAARFVSNRGEFGGWSEMAICTIPIKGVAGAGLTAPAGV